MAKFEVIDIPKPIDYDENPQSYRQISVVVLSDTHNRHELYGVPDGDILLHCGDFTNGNDLDYSINQIIIKWNVTYRRWGSKTLAAEVHERIKPRIHCFGHVHDDQGYKYSEEGTGTMYINAAGDFSKKCFKFNVYVDLEKHRRQGNIGSVNRDLFELCDIL